MEIIDLDLIYNGIKMIVNIISKKFKIMHYW